MTDGGEGGAVASARRGINRREFLKLGGAGLAGVALLGAAGCGGGGSQGGGGLTEVTLSFGREPSGTLAQLIKKFNTQHKGKIKVTWRHMPADTGQYFNQIRTEFQAQKSNIDLIIGDVIWPVQLAANGWLLDLSSRFSQGDRSNFLPGPIQSMSYKGKIYGVPFYTDAGMLYYRKDLLQKSGFKSPPKTWDELKTMARKVMKDSGVPNGFVFQGDKYEGGVCNAMEYIWTNGGEVLKGNVGNNVVVGKSGVPGLQTERSMIADGIAPQAVATYQEPDCEAPFAAQANTVFCRNWPYMYALLGTTYPKLKKEQVGLAPIPVSGNNQTASTLGGWNFYISALSDSSKQDAAYEFVKFMTSPAQQKEWALKGSYLPTVKSLYSDKEILSKVPAIGLNKTSIQHTKPRPVSPYYSDMSLDMQDQFNASLKGAESPQQAAQTLQGQLAKIVKQGQA